MPALDRTGPSGQGPMTGRGQGVSVGRGRGLFRGTALGRGLGRGFGRGLGIRGRLQGRGAASVAVCTCPECGRTVPHTRGIPCTQMECPKCSVPMRGDYCLPDEPQGNQKTQQS